MAPLLEKDLASAVLRDVAEAAPDYLADVDTRLVDDVKTRALLADLDGPPPERGTGSAVYVSA